MKKIEEQKASQINIYLDRLNNRLNYLDNQSINIQKKIDERDNEITRIRQSINEEIQFLKEKTIEINKILENNKKIIRLIVAEFKNIIKQENMNKLNERIESWAPEKLITRKEIIKNLQP